MSGKFCHEKMSIFYTKHVRAENNRLEFLLVNFDYYDGNDMLARLFEEEYGMKAEPKFDGIYYSVTRLRSDDTEYVLVWHEDVGNYLYSVEQKPETLELLETRLRSSIKRLNDILR